MRPLRRAGAPGARRSRAVRPSRWPGRILAALLLLAATAVLGLPGQAAAQDGLLPRVDGASVATTSRAAPSPAPSGGSTAGSTDPNLALSPGVTDGEIPAGHRLTPAQARDIARADPEVARERRENPGSYDAIFLKGQTRWQLSLYRRQKPLKEIGQVIVDDRTARVTESWTGPYVAWTMARGYDGAFGGQATNPYVWIGFLAAFLLPFVGLRPRRLPPVELLLLAGFSIPLAFFNTARLPPAVLLSALLLVLLLGRALHVTLARPRRPRALHLAVPVRWLAVLAVALFAFRAVLATTGGNVIDVGYASVVGADRLAHLQQLYGAFPEAIGRGDTYGPLTYLFYVPFEIVWPWRGGWDTLQAATAAAVALDALVVLCLYRLGVRSARSRPRRRRRAGAEARQPVDPGTVGDRAAGAAVAGAEAARRGSRRGVLYAYLWIASPWSLYAMSSAANDALVSLALVLLLLAATSGGRAVSVALAAAAKLAPASLVPVVATHPAQEPEPGEPAERRRARLGPRRLLGFALICGSVVVAAVAVGLVGGGSPALLVERTLGYQADRDAPFTPWGLYEWETVTSVLRVAAVALGVGLALLPRRADRAGLAAAMLAVLVGFQLATEYWFYLYLTWLVPLVLVMALHGRPLDEPARLVPWLGRRPGRSPPPEPAHAVASSREPVLRLDGEPRRGASGG